MGLATPEQFDEWNKAWKVAVASGSQETLLAFICRERGLAEDVFLQQLAQALNWPYLDLPKVDRARRGAEPYFHQGRLPILRPADPGQRRHAAGGREQPVRHGDAQRGAVRRARPGAVSRWPPRSRSRRRSRSTTASAPRRSTRWPRTSRSNCWWARTRKSPRATRRPASSSSSTRSSGRPSRTAPRTFTSSRRRTSCASATALTASCTRRRCRRSSSATRPR